MQSAAEERLWASHAKKIWCGHGLGWLGVGQLQKIINDDFAAYVSRRLYYYRAIYPPGPGIEDFLEPERPSPKEAVVAW